MLSLATSVGAGPDRLGWSTISGNALFISVYIPPFHSGSVCVYICVFMSAFFKAPYRISSPTDSRRTSRAPSTPFSLRRLRVFVDGRAHLVLMKVAQIRGECQAAADRFHPVRARHHAFLVGSEDGRGP